MKVTQKNVDDLTLTITISIDKSDYSEKSKKILNDYRKKAEIKGFRKGMAPMSLIEKMHGQNAVLDSVNELISQGLNDHIKNNKINIIGEPLPNVTEQKEINWESNEPLEFLFDVALAPKFDLVLDKDFKVPYYEVKISDKSKNEYKSNLLRQFGSLQPVETVEEEDFIIADLIKGDKKVEGTYISLKSIEDSKIKKLFIGKEVGATFQIDVNKAFVNDSDRAALLKIKKEELSTVEPLYDVVVKEVKRFAEAEENQDLYDKMFGKDVVKSTEDFDSKVTERMAAEYSLESEYRFMIDARNSLIEKSGIRIPEDFLKRWLYSVNEGKFTNEEIERDFPLFAQDFKWQMIREFIMKEQKIEVKKENLLDHAKKIASYQFSMYGLNSVPEEQLNQYAESLLANEKEGRRIYEKVEDDMVLEYVKTVVTLSVKKVTMEELQKLTN
jgi:trigger factor